MSKLIEKDPQATIALCYIRQSMTRDENDTNSPERQRANIQAFCQTKGWIPEWYEDTGGHKSGRKEEGRPQWLALKKRLNDPDVIALVANDLSRLHRKGWRIGDLIDTLNGYGVALAIAAPGRQQIDTSTQQGRMMVQLGAMFDEYYAEDIAQRSRDSVLYRKAQGITIGMPPFGTLRNSEGQLEPTPEGAWLLPNGKFVRGNALQLPEEGAIWRGYYEAAHRILELYAEGKIGTEQIAYQMNELGWAFRNRQGKPRRFNNDDIRRIIANWPEYGGMVLGQKAKNRAGYNEPRSEEVVFDEKRTVFPVELLRQVGAVRQQRTLKPSNNGIRKSSYSYPLGQITYCAHCEHLAIEQHDPQFRSTLGGTNTYGTFRYKHKRGVLCGVHNRSVLCEHYEADFFRLLQLLSVRPDAVDLMTTMALQPEFGVQSKLKEVDLEAKKQEAIAVCRQRLENAKFLLLEGDLTPEEYLQRKDQNEREIAHWQTFTTERQQLAMELTMCLQTVERVATLWQHASPDDKRGLAQSLFEEIIYDLDTQRIVDFRLKPWAERFLVLRAKLYDTPYIKEGGRDDDTPIGGNEGGDQLRSTEASSVEKARMGQLRTQP